jgi:hypothetical protein
MNGNSIRLSRVRSGVVDVGFHSAFEAGEIGERVGRDRRSDERKD